MPDVVSAMSAIEIYKKASPSVVVIYNFDGTGKKRTLGSGVVMPCGDVATNYHVIEAASRLSVVYKGVEYIAKPKYTDNSNDVAVLSVQGLDAPKAELCENRQLKVGERVYAIGSPHGLEQSLSDGIISGFREYEGVRYIQTTAPISCGSSGGGVFNDEGQLVGLSTFYLNESQQLNFAVPVEFVSDLVKRQGRPPVIKRNSSEWNQKALILEQKKDWLAMLRESKNWTVAEPVSSKAWYFLGLAFQKTGELDKSIDALQEAVQINPEYSSAWVEMGSSYGQEGKMNDAMIAYGKAIQADRNNAEAWHKIGIIYRKKANDPKSVEAFRHALQIDPKCISAWFDLGLTLQDMHDYKGSVDAFLHVVELNQDNAFAWHNLGFAYRALGDLSKSIDAFRQALRIDPNFDSSWINLAYTYGLNGQRSKRFDTYRMAISTNPKNSDAWVGLGIAYSDDGKYGKEVEAYLHALYINPKNAQALFNLGAHYTSDSDREKLMELYRRLMDVDSMMAKKFCSSYILPQ